MITCIPDTYIPDGRNCTTQTLYAAMIGRFVEGMYTTYEAANKALAGQAGRLRIIVVPSGRVVTVFGDTMEHGYPIQ
jgi:hypothetical protein